METSVKEQTKDKMHWRDKLWTLHNGLYGQINILSVMASHWDDQL